MHKKPKYEFNQQAATQNLRGQQVIFSINNPRLDHEFNMEFGPMDDYVEKDDGIYYILSPLQFDRFIDFAMSHGFDIDKDIHQVDSLSEEGNVTGGGEAYLPSLHVPKKKINPFKESEDPYRIEVAVSDAKKAQEIIRSDRLYSRNIRMYSSNLFLADDPEIISQLFDEFEKNAVQMLSYNVPSETSDFYESILSGYKEVPGFRPGHTPDKGGFQYKDLWNMNEDACWSGYQQIGMKDKGGKQVPNCVPVNENEDLDKETLFKIYNVPKGAIKPSAKKEKNGYTIKYTDPKTGSLTTGFLSQVRIDKYLKGELKENIKRDQKVKIVKGTHAGNTAIVHDFDSDKDTASGNDWVDVLIGNKKEKKTVKASELKPINENYAQFRNSTKTRSGSEQYHQAVKLVKKKVQEISKLHSYMERMQQELSETQEGLKKRKYTQMAIDKIKAEIKELNNKVRKLK